MSGLQGSARQSLVAASALAQPGAGYQQVKQLSSNALSLHSTARWTVTLLTGGAQPGVRLELHMIHLLWLTPHRVAFPDCCVESTSLRLLLDAEAFVTA